VIEVTLVVDVLGDTENPSTPAQETQEGLLAAVIYTAIASTIVPTLERTKEFIPDLPWEGVRVNSMTIDETSDSLVDYLAKRAAGFQGSNDASPEVGDPGDPPVPDAPCIGCGCLFIIPAAMRMGEPCHRCGNKHEPIGNFTMPDRTAEESEMFLEHIRNAFKGSGRQQGVGQRQFPDQVPGPGEVFPH